MKTKQLIKISRIIDKMDIKKELIKIEATDNTEVGKEIVAIFFANLHKAEKEIYEFIADYKKITVEEAEEVDIVEILKEIYKENGLDNFLAIA